LAENLVKIGGESTLKAGQSTPKAPAGKFTLENLKNFARGSKTEAEQLSKNGLQKNFRPIEELDPKTGKEGKSIPDAFKQEDKQTVEIKDVKQQGLTRQLRIQKEYSNKNGYQPELIINKEAKLSQPLKDAGFDIKPYASMPQDATRVAPPPPSSEYTLDCRGNPDCI
jgi:hypothetical protein